MSLLYSLERGWSEALCKSQPVLGEMLSRGPEEQRRLGYFHTLREIYQQPSTWIHTAESMQQSARELSPLVKSISCVILTGSGSSEFAGDCVRMVMQKELQVKKDYSAVGEDIGPELGASFIKAYGEAHPDEVKYFGVGRTILEQTLAQPGCAGIRLYNALNEKGRVIAVSG